MSEDERDAAEQWLWERFQRVPELLRQRREITHKMGQLLNEPNQSPKWLDRMSALAERKQKIDLELNDWQISECDR